MKILLFCLAFRLGASTVQQTLPPGAQLTQYVVELQRNPDNDLLREKIIKFVLTLDSRLATPPEADEQAGAAAYAFQHATSEGDFAEAGEIYGKAALQAPWVPEYYFNQGVAFEKAKRYESAIAAFKWYMIAMPEAQDAGDVRQRIGGLKYIVQKQDEAAATEHARHDAELQAQRIREQAAEQERLRVQQERAARLASLDPLIRSLNGAQYAYVQSGRDAYNLRCSATYWIVDDKVQEKARCDDGKRVSEASFTYPIQGQTFYVDMNSFSSTGDFCQLPYKR